MLKDWCEFFYLLLFNYNSESELNSSIFVIKASASTGFFFGGNAGGVSNVSGLRTPSSTIDGDEMLLVVVTFGSNGTCCTTGGVLDYSIDIL